jgi:hypothetical protein
MALSASISTSSATMLDNYFPSHQPAVKVAGVRRMTRPSKPSACVRDAANALNDSVTPGHGRKRKGSNSSLHRHVAHKVVLDSDGSESSDVENASDASTPSLKAASDTNETTDSDGTDTDEAQAAYQRTKEMGDEDREVSLNF